MGREHAVSAQVGSRAGRLRRDGGGRLRAQAPAPPPPPPDGPRYVVTYVEVKPTPRLEAEKLVRQFRDATRKEAGNLRAEALQRIGQMQHFVLLEAWKDQAAVDAHFKAPAAVPVPRQDQGDPERAHRRPGALPAVGRPAGGQGRPARRWPW